MDWVYKAADSKLDHIGTMLLADRDGFLCRSAFEEKNRTWADNVRRVALGDTINFYFAKKGRKPAGIGAFCVVEPNLQHPMHAAFGDHVQESALYIVADPTFIKRRDPQGAYKEDPVIGHYTGWAIRRIGKAPGFRSEMFRNMTALQPYGTQIK